MEGTSLPNEGPDNKAERARADTATKIPVIWLFGKTQAGKTSIAVALTGTGAEGIGLGFQRTTTEPTLLPWPPPDRKSTRLNSSHIQKSRMPSSA